MRKRRRRSQAALLCLVMICGYLVAGHHQATALHGFCSDHGLQIHLDRHQHHQPLTPLAAAGRLERPVHVHGAHFCAALAFLSQSSEPPAGLPQLGELAQVPLRPLPLATERRRAIPLLHQAPKHSPPA